MRSKPKSEQRPCRREDEEFPGNDVPGDFLFRKIASAARLREGASGVQDFLRVVRQESPGSLREIARVLSWPVPVAAAVRRELEKREILSRTGGIHLTEYGVRLMGGSPETALMRPCPECEGTGLHIPKGFSDKWLPEFENLCRLRPRADVSLDQALATPMTNLKRVFYLVSELNLAHRTGLFLGDDDWTSACLGWFLSRMWPDLKYRLLVWDIDERVCQGLSEWAAASGVCLETSVVDLRSPPSEWERIEVDYVLTDPPYTLEGLALFSVWARHRLPPDRGDFLLSYPRRESERQAEVERCWLDAGFSMYRMMMGLNRYEGNALHAGQSAWWHLKVAKPESRETLKRILETPIGQKIYTRYSASR